VLPIMNRKLAGMDATVDFPGQEVDRDRSQKYQ